MDDDIVFGKALIEAYRLERQYARDPRIILCPMTIKLMKYHMGYYGEPEHSPQNREVLIDADGQYFINYLMATWPDVAENPELDLIEKHKEMVISKLEKYRNDPRIWAKYAWVLNYHNYFCTDVVGIDGSHCINTSYLTIKPGSIL
jgi:hypothetical protein